MIEVADVFRRFAAGYLSAHGASLLPSHRRAIEDILTCRTAHSAARSWRCEQCDTGDVFLAFPVPAPQVASEVPRTTPKPRSGLNVAGRRCCRCRSFPRHRHGARRVARGIAMLISATVMPC